MGAAAAPVVVPTGAAALPFGRRLWNILLLGAGWCCTASALFVQISNTSLTAATIEGGGPALQTLPVALFTLAAAAAVLPAAVAMRAWGRKPVVVLVACLGIMGACLELLSLHRGGFGLLTFGALLQGPSFSVANNYRFMAAEFSPPHFRPRAISIVVLCGVPAAVVGPEFARQALLALPPIGGFLVLIGVQVALLLLMLCVDWRSLAAIEAAGDAAAAGAAAEARTAAAGGKRPGGGAEAAAAAAGAASGSKSSGSGAASAPDPKSGGGGGAFSAAPDPEKGRLEAPLLSYRALLLHQAFIAPALICAGSFSGMSALMNITGPEIIRSRGASALSMSVWVIEAHIVGMYLPGLFSADLIRWIGAPLTSVFGCALLLAGNAIYYGGIAPAVFFAGMVVVGLGWHFAYVGASAAIVAVYAREPRRKLMVQGATDTTVIALTGLAIGSAPALAHAMGWVPFISLWMGLHGALFLVAAEFAARGWLQRRRAAAAAAAETEAAAGAADGSAAAAAAAALDAPKGGL